MHFAIRSVLFIFILIAPYSSGAQDSLLKKMAAENHATFTYNGDTFSGEGWVNIKKQVQSTYNVLIGEDHFTNEIPAFVEAVLQAGEFDNFIIELDPYSTEIIENSIMSYSDKERRAFNEKYKSHFSFYGLAPEYNLLTLAVQEGINLMGAEQIVKFGDLLVLQELASITKNEQARNIYKVMIDRSEEQFEKFLNDPEQPLYFMSSHFKDQLEILDSLELSGMEESVIKEMKISRSIYEQNNHKMRIQLIKRILLNNFPEWYQTKNLFKYGAVHMPSGESLLSIYDVGNLVSNVSDARFDDSYHIAVVAKSGMKGAPFPGFPKSQINSSKGMLSNLAPFFDFVKENKWYAFDLLPIRRALNDGELALQNVLLERVVQGYNTLVIIPEATAAEF